MRTCAKRLEDIVFEISLIARDTKSQSAVKFRTILDFVGNHCFVWNVIKNSNDASVEANQLR